VERSVPCVRPTAIPLSCAEATHAEGAADEVRCARGASAPGWRTARRQLQRFVRRRAHSFHLRRAPRTPRLKDHRFGAAGAPAPRLRASRPHQRLAESSRPPVVKLITEQSKHRSARLREGPCLLAISHLRAAGEAAATHLQFTAHGVDPTFLSRSRIHSGPPNVLSLSCAEATHAEGAADEVRCARGASAPGQTRARRQLQRRVRPPRTIAYLLWEFYPVFPHLLADLDINLKYQLPEDLCDLPDIAGGHGYPLAVSFSAGTMNQVVASADRFRDAW
jgi:hypothetical protein